MFTALPVSQCPSCDNMIVLPQFSSTCWLNAILMCLFFSQGTRYIIENALYDRRHQFTSRIDKKLLQYYIDLLYAHTNKRISTKPEYILKLFEHNNPEIFTFENSASDLYRFTPRYKQGAYGWAVIRYILDVIYGKVSPIFIAHEISPNSNMFELYDSDHNYFYYHANKFNTKVQSPTPLYQKFSIMKDKPELLVLLVKCGYISNPHIVIDFMIDMNKEIVIIQGIRYIVDSVYIANRPDIGKFDISHAIAGITCMNRRYMYNGWVVNTTDKARYKTIQNAIRARNAPCKPILFDWIANTKNFCIDDINCTFPEFDNESSKMCFNNKNGSRIYFLVREDIFLHANCHPNNNKVINKNTFNHNPYSAVPISVPTV